MRCLQLLEPARSLEHLSLHPLFRTLRGPPEPIGRGDESGDRGAPLGAPDRVIVPAATIFAENTEHSIDLGDEDAAFDKPHTIEPRCGGVVASTVGRYEQAACCHAAIVLERTHCAFGLLDVVIDDPLRLRRELDFEGQGASRSGEFPVCVLLPSRRLAGGRWQAEDVLPERRQRAGDGVVMSRAEVVEELSAPAVEPWPVRAEARQ
jgi:hypothetical protein